MKKIERALVSVFDKKDILDFVRVLVNEFGVEILSTGGTGKLLEKNGINYIKISEYTNSPEMFDGRVKTLHPKIEGGILYRRSLEKDVEEAKNYDGIIELPWCGEENCAKEIENILDKNTLGLPIGDNSCEYSCPLCNKKAISWMRYAKTY